MVGESASSPYRLLGHAINRISDLMESGESSFRIAITAELAEDDCFRTVLDGYIGESTYILGDTVRDDHTVFLLFKRS